MNGSIRILGVDPGSRTTGFGVIEHGGGVSRALTWGAIHTTGSELSERLRSIFDQLAAVVREHAPQEVAVEKVFVNRNADSALKLGQARGAALCAVFTTGAAIYEYAPRQIKLAVVGNGAADKRQVQHMMQVLLRLERTPQTDAADALAVAVCHAHMRGVPGALVPGRGR